MTVENFKKLVKGNSITSIIMALNTLQYDVLESLKKEYNTNNIELLAFKLQ